MKLSDHVEAIRLLIDKSFRNRLGRMGITEKQILPIENIPSEYHTDRQRIEIVREVFIAETKTNENAYDKLVEELTFTLFNRLAALKVMEAHTLFPEVITQREIHGSRSFAHLAWLEQHPEARSEESEGLIAFLEDQFSHLSSEIPLFSLEHSYHLLPTAIELSGIITAFNIVETDTQVETDIWQSDDVLGWLYESYNNQKKADHKASKAKTEYNRVSLQSQVYTPRWVVQFLVDNSLGKLYLEMYPDSDIRNRYKIANAPTTQTRDYKPLIDLRLIDPATGSGNFILYAFDLFYDLYLDQIENYGADYDENEIAKLIIENNLYGIDLDNRAIQLAQLGLYIKAKRKKRSVKIDHFNVVSSDFYLPPYKEVQSIFETNTDLDSKQKEIIRNIWTDLQQAYKFGSLIRLEEKLSISLHGLASGGVTLFSNEEVENYEQFRNDFFVNLQDAVEQNAARHGHTFLNTKTQDAIIFLQLLTQKYDVAVANPPYTDSSDFGDELKAFINANYSKPHKFNTNLYVTFIKRCYELVDYSGKIALIHPMTFMYISTFDDVRKFLLDKCQIEIFIEWGFLGIFNPKVRVDASFYILEKSKPISTSIFIKLNHIYEGRRYQYFSESYNDLLNYRRNSNNYEIEQHKLKIIKSSPFIYWISDEFRNRFKNQTIKDIGSAKPGLQTGNNERFLRFWWELDKENISISINDKKKWISYAKGGNYNKWVGNLWLKVNWGNEGNELINFVDENGKQRSVLRNQKYYFKEGITYSATGGKPSFRLLPVNSIFDVGGASIFVDHGKSTKYAIALLNSKVTHYLLDCLNPTSNYQKGDIDRLLYFENSETKTNVEELADRCIQIKTQLLEFSLIEESIFNSPLLKFDNDTLRDRVFYYINHTNSLLAEVLICESIIDLLIIDGYNFSNEDLNTIYLKQGEKSIGELPISQIAKESFLNQLQSPLHSVKLHIQNLPISDFEEQKINEIKDSFTTIYQSNNDLESFCIRNQVNPINVWFWFKQANILPQARAAEITLEFLADAIRTILMEDEDGIIPLVGLPGEPRLLDRLEQHCLAKGFTSAQFMQLDSLLGRPVSEYIEQYFFNDLSNLLNLFMYLPKTPFIWHLSSGPQQGFEVYIIIYKWNRDSLFKLKSQYISFRVENLEYRLIQLQGVETAQAQNEKETIRLQLREIETFTAKIDELIAEGYNPILDDGVGKNLAPLQEKGLLKADIFKKNQLEKYLNADW